MIYTTRYVVPMSHFSFCPAPQTFQIASPIQFLPTRPTDSGIPVHATDVHSSDSLGERHSNVDHLTRTRCALNFRSEAPRVRRTSEGKRNYVALFLYEI